MNTAASGARGKAQGVTLIELVLAMVLLGLVAALIVPVVWYGRFGANPVPTAQATAIAQSVLEQVMVADYNQPFGNKCNGKANTTSKNGFSITTICEHLKWQGIPKRKENDAEYLQVQVTGPSVSNITLGAWRTKYTFNGTAPGHNGHNGHNGNGKQ
ncbi:MAG: prepilin-type N-terminal cleavage/methylation domain-containing protein [Acidithiobacillus sp.]